MIDFIKKIFGRDVKTNMKELISKGAQIIDVRTKEEYQRGHIKGSINIPLQVFPNNLSKISKDKPIITCCASGVRSASAKSILESRGYPEVYNGGGWQSLKQKIS